MTIYNRPEDVPAFAESGDVVQPTNPEIQEGWPESTVPPSRQRFNWILNFVANAVKYLLQRGVAEWNMDEDYPLAGRVQHAGVTWVAILANTGVEPGTDALTWERWGFTVSELLSTVDGYLTKSVAGGVTVTLTAAEARSSIFNFTGVLTANINVVVPTSAKRFVVRNNTTGAFTLTVKTAAGTGIAVTQGRMTQLLCDGTNVVDPKTDFVSPAMTGNPTAPTPTVGDNDTSVATTAFVKTAIDNLKTKLTVSTTFYVATTGSDSNDGLTIGTPFLTIQKAWDNLFTNYDLNGKAVVIQLADGTYTGGLAALGIPVGQRAIGSIIFQGNAATPGNVIVSVTGNNCFSASESAGFQVQNLRVQTTTSGSGFYAAFQGQIKLGAGIIFGACATAGIIAASRGSVFVGFNYSILGGGSYHLYATAQGFISSNALTATLTGTPAFTIFALAQDSSIIYQPSVVFSGAATGQRYNGSGLSLLQTVGGGASFFPGNAAGAVTTGSQYV